MFNHSLIYFYGYWDIKLTFTSIISRGIIEEEEEDETSMM